MLLQDVVGLIVLKEVRGSLAVNVTAMTDDSRKVTPGTLFVAFRGEHADGHLFVEQAVRQGAVAVLVEEPCAVSVTQLIVPSTRRIAPLLAHAIYGYPARAMNMIGVTGTNGKSTTTIFIERILRQAGKATGLIGSIELRASAGTLQTATMTTPTTPQAVEFVRILQEMRTLGTEYVVMEASSHALDQARMAGVAFRVAAFSNLTQDHLNYHGTMEAYGKAKGLLFSRLGNDFAPSPDGGLPIAVLNADDAWSATYAKDTVQQVVTYGIDQKADVRATEVRIDRKGVAFRLATFAGDADIELPLPGRFNVYNALCAAGSCLALGVPLAVVVAALQQMEGVPGRFEQVSAGQPFSVIVDYSHTPDSLKNALTLIREFCTGRVLTVVGCGGDRDRTKRPLMAQVAMKYSDFTVFTSDNPRTEDPEAILDDMEAGIRDADHRNYTRQVLRREAIRTALAAAREDDVVLIAGKGDETYQIIGKTHHDFDDRQVAAEILRGLK